VTTYPLLHQRRRNFGPQFAPGTEAATTRDAVRTVVAAHGPATARQVEELLQHEDPERLEGWGWRWTTVKRCLELLLDDGELAVAHRTSTFERAYALAE